MYDNRFYPVITYPISATGSTLIFTNCLEENCQAGVLINHISDHLPMYNVWNDDTAVDDRNVMYSVRRRLIDDNRVFQIL